MPTKSKKLFKKKIVTSKPKAKSLKKNFFHPAIEAELESTRLLYLELVNSIEEGDLHKRPSLLSWSLKEELVHVGSNLWNIIPTSVANSRKGKNMPKLPAIVGHIFSHVIYRLEARQFTKETLIKRYEQSHKEALSLLKSLSPEELNFETQTLSGTTTLENVFHTHTSHFKNHEIRIKKLLART